MYDFDSLYPTTAIPIAPAAPKKKAGNVVSNKEDLFVGRDATKPRMTVEQEKVRKAFPNLFRFYKEGKLIKIKGRLKTNFGRWFTIEIHLSQDYPYIIPDILVFGGIDSKCPHVYRSGHICVMTSSQWSPVYGVSFLIKRTAVWLNKYELWSARGKTKWPGTDGHRTGLTRDPMMDYLRQNNLLRRG